MPGDLQVGAMVSIIENKNEFYAWLSFMRRYFLVIALGNLVWEALHMLLYTIWYEVHGNKSFLQGCIVRAGIFSLLWPV